MRRKLFLVVVLFVILIMGCSSKEDFDYEDGIEHIDNGKEVVISEVLKGYLSGMGGEGIKGEGFMFNSEKEWNYFLEQLDCCDDIDFNKSIIDILEEGQIDFKGYSVIAVFDEPLPVSGITINIFKILEYEDKLLVEYKREKHNLSSAMRQPFHIVKINKSIKSIVFKDLDESGVK